MRLRDRAIAAHRNRRPDPPAEPSDLQRTAAREVGRICGVEVDPAAVQDRGLYDDGTYRCEVAVDGLRFRFRARWGGRDWRYGTNWTDVQVGRIKKRWIGVRDLEELGAVLDPRPTTTKGGRDDG